MTPRHLALASLLASALALGACSEETSSQKAGSGDGPTQGSGSSNQPDAARNGGPRTP